MSRLLLVDGNALLYRAYFAFPKELTTPKGELIGAVYGFTRILLGSIKTLKPDALAVSFDLRGPTFRHKQYAAYKATRQKMPDELASQIKRTHELVEHLECPIYTLEGFEADDLIGTLATQAAELDPNNTVVILTGDQDILQLVNEQVSVYMPSSATKSVVLYTPEGVIEKYGFTPIQIIEYKALRGDPSDNIPGVPGIGEVTATKLIQEFGTITDLYKALEAGKAEHLKTGVKQKLIEHKASAFLSHDLATIRINAPISFDPGKTKLELLHPEKLVSLFQELGFKSLIHELPGSHKLVAEAADIFSAEAATPDLPVEPPSESAEIDQRLAPILREMESHGVKVDRSYLKKLEAEFDTELTAIKERLHEWAGEVFNPDSPQQVGHILYEVLHIPTTNVRKGKTGFTTDATTLQELASEYPIAQELLNYRELMKLQTTYIRPLPELLDEHDRVHTSYSPDTSTGRISSKNPNLQNIPIRSEQGLRIRKAFIAEPGKVLVGADYSQIELRIAAHLSNDLVMKEAFSKGTDFHAETAARMNVDRRTAKVINFSILYGKGAFGFARDLGITVAEAKSYIEQYFKAYPALRPYLDKVLTEAREKGYAETLLGRRRYFPDLTARNFQHRSAAEREAMNLPIQGTGADILKKAMCILDERLKKELPTTYLILTVHDELILEVPQTEQTQAATILHDVMTSTNPLSVPLEVTVKAGLTWADMQELDAKQ